MRFLLDNCTSVEVRPAIVERGHECWTANEAGLADASDDDLLLYAIEKGAVLITHDVKFARRHSATTSGRMVHLGCDQMDAYDIVERWLQFVEGALEHTTDLHVRMNHVSYEVGANWA